MVFWYLSSSLARANGACQDHVENLQHDVLSSLLDMVAVIKKLIHVLLTISHIPISSL